MRWVFATLIVAMLAVVVACSSRQAAGVSTEFGPRSEPPAEQPAETSLDQEPEPAVEKKKPARPRPGYQAAPRRRSGPMAYSREMKLLYVEQSFRWQARALNTALKRDTGLSYQGFFCDAQPGWTQPVSVWMEDDRPEPLESPFYADGKYVTTLRGFLNLDYDVVIIGDVDTDSVKGNHWEWLNQYVLHGGALIMMPGQTHHPADYMSFDGYDDLCPVTVDGEKPEIDTQAMKFYGLTEAGRTHEIMQTAKDPARNTELWGEEVDGGYERGQLSGMYWYFPAAGADEDATVLARAVKPGQAIEDGRPLMVTKEYGRGRVLWVGTDDCWRWREFVGSYYFYGFFQRAIRWVTDDSGP